MATICGSTAAIEVPSIIQKGSRDEFVALNKGGRIHLRMSFVLTEDEKKKIETMVRYTLNRCSKTWLLLFGTLQSITSEQELTSVHLTHRE